MFPHIPTYKADNGPAQLVLSILNDPLKHRPPTLTRAKRTILCKITL